MRHLPDNSSLAYELWKLAFTQGALSYLQTRNIQPWEATPEQTREAGAFGHHAATFVKNAYRSLLTIPYEPSE